MLNEIPTAYERQKTWIIKWLRRGYPNNGTDVTDEKFQEAFAEEFNAAFRPKMFGAQPCPLAMRTLKRMKDDGTLKRGIISIIEMGPEFPNWVYVYSLARPPKELLK